MPQATESPVTQQITDCAYRLGFDLVRVTSADPLGHAEDVLKERIAAGLMSGLDWFTAERATVSARPQALLPNARSVISLATFYLTDAPRDLSAPGDPHGKLSCYAWGDDYHVVIRHRLDELAQFVRDLAPPGDEKAIVFVDTGRMIDRAVAERSGLGWYGKNTCILTKHWGSWVFLSELVTSLPLATDTPLQANCGQCDICLRACPTGALVAPYVLDNRRCISYLTIELRGSIPLELRPLIGTHIFGCDICQAVCPVNHLAERRLRTDGRLAGRQRVEFQPRSGVGSSPALLPLLALTEDEFRERFRNSPVKRAKWRGLLRNVCVALGNTGDPAAVPALTEALHHAEPLVRGHAAWALGRIGGSPARDALIGALRSEPNLGVQQELRCALDTFTTTDNLVHEHDTCSGITSPLLYGHPLPSQGRGLGG